MNAQIKTLTARIEAHEDSNDGSVAWVEELHEMLNQLAELENEFDN